jgi:GNAT superfamily N-acetyltransferase
MNITYRRTRRADLDACANLIKYTYNDLRKRVGMQRVRFPQGHPNSFEHYLKTDPKYAYCAFHGDKMVGFTQAINRGKHWFLAFLFIHPRYQDKKVGKELLGKVWRDEPGVIHSLATFSYNPQAIGIYSRFGMAPIAGMARFELPPRKLTIPAMAGVSTRFYRGAADQRFIDQLEPSLRGFTRKQDWKQFFGQKKYHQLIFTKGGKRVGYGIISDTGLIGPVGAVSSAMLQEVLKGLLQYAATLSVKNLIVHLPAANIKSYQLLLAAGFRITEIVVFMSDHHYLDLQRYVPATLSMV